MLRNKVKVWLSSDFLEGSSVVDAPEWFRTDADRKTLARHLKVKYERVTSDHLLAVCRAGNGIVSIQMLHFMAANAGYQLVSNALPSEKSSYRTRLWNPSEEGTLFGWSNILGILSRRNTLRKRVA